MKKALDSPAHPSIFLVHGRREKRMNTKRGDVRYAVLIGLVYSQFVLHCKSVNTAISYSEVPRFPEKGVFSGTTLLPAEET
jgi:hypothetical protein